MAAEDSHVSYKIIVSGLFENITHEILEDKFSTFGKVKEVVIGKNNSEITADITLIASKTNIAKCFSTLQNTKWKKNTLKLQLDDFKHGKNTERKTKFFPDVSINNQLAVNQLYHAHPKYSENEDDGVREINSFTEVDTESSSVNLKRIADLEKRLEYSSSVWKDDYTCKENDRDKFKLLQGGQKRNQKEFDRNNYEKIEKNTLVIGENGTKVVTRNANSEKKIFDNEKRLNSLKSLQDSFNYKKNVIKNAISASLDSRKVKKIKFFGDEDYNNSDKTFNINANNSSSFQLFDDNDDNDDTDNTFKLKPQFDGCKGQKLYELQSRLGNDPRFQVDEQFIDDDEIIDGAFTAEADETKKNLEILEKIVGPVHRTNSKKEKFNTMVRYNPLQADHQIYEIKQSEESSPKKSKKVEISQEPVPEPKVSKETYYQIKSDLVNSFIPGKSEPFSLLKALGRDQTVDVEKNRKPEPNTTVTTNEVKKNFPTQFFGGHSERNPLDKKSQLTNRIVSGNNNKMSSGETFFFKLDDPRLDEAVKFFCCTKSSEVLRSEWQKRRENVLFAVKVETKRILKRKHPVQKLGNKSKKFQKINKRKKTLGY